MGALTPIGMAVACALTSCGTLTGIDDFVVDCVDTPCNGDGGLTPDAGAADARPTGDASVAPTCPPPDTPETVGGKVVPQCSPVELADVDRTAPAAVRVINAPDSDEQAAYDPNCMTIKAGQSVTWRGKLSSHPLINRENSTTNNPIHYTPSAATEFTVTFGCPGDFNFSCNKHANFMLGTIRVVP